MKLQPLFLASVALVATALVFARRHNSFLTSLGPSRGRRLWSLMAVLIFFAITFTVTFYVWCYVVCLFITLFNAHIAQEKTECVNATFIAVAALVCTYALASLVVRAWSIGRKLAAGRKRSAQSDFYWRIVFPQEQKVASRRAALHEGDK